MLYYLILTYLCLDIYSWAIHQIDIIVDIYIHIHYFHRMLSTKFCVWVWSLLLLRPLPVLVNWNSVSQLTQSQAEVAAKVDAKLKQQTLCIIIGFASFRFYNLNILYSGQRLWCCYFNFLDNWQWVDDWDSLTVCGQVRECWGPGHTSVPRYPV